MQLSTFQFKGLSMNYARWGEGEHALLAFHGFGRSQKDFQTFTAPLSKVFSIYAFDIFFHGGSHIGDRSVDQSPLKPEELAAFIQSFFDREGIDKAALMGYSLGGRIAMKIAELLPDKVSQLFLIAPDGLIVDRWYALFSHYAMGRSAFRFFIRNNVALFKTLTAIVGLRLISKKRGNFIRGQIKTNELQEKVYKVWTFLRFIEPDQRELASQLQHHGIAAYTFFGKYDSIIPSKNAKRLKALLPEMNIHILESGHNMLTLKNIEAILKNGWIKPL